MNIDEIYTLPLKYKEICSIMEDKEVSGGKNRINQLNKWGRLYDITKENSKYIVHKKWSEKEIIQRECENKYKILIEQTLLSYIMSIPSKKTKTLSYGEIYEIIHMVNENYRKIKNQPWKYEDCFDFKYNNQSIQSQEDEISEYYKLINSYYQISNGFLKNHLKNAIKELEITEDNNNGVFYVYRGYRFFTRYKIYNQDGTPYYRISEHEATDEQIAQMIDKEMLALEYAEVTKIYDEDGINYHYKKEELSFMPQKATKYSEYIRLAIEEMGYDGYCKTFKFVWGEKAVELKYNNIMKCKVLLNENVQKGLIELKLFRDKQIDKDDLKILVDKTIKH